MGVIRKTVPSQDGLVRKAEIKVVQQGAAKVYNRPISEIVFLSSPVLCLLVMSCGILKQVTASTALLLNSRGDGMSELMKFFCFASINRELELHH